MRILPHRPRAIRGMNSNEHLGDTGGTNGVPPPGADLHGRPLPVRGAYYRTRGRHSRVVIRAYTNPHSQADLLSPESAPLRLPPLAPGTFLGPVHAVDHSHVFVSVQIEYPGSYGLLVWINIWTSSPRPVMLARSIPEHCVLTWRANGWVDRYID